MADRPARQLLRAVAAAWRELVRVPQWAWTRRRTIILRAYALAILLVVAWTGYTAVAYLTRSVFTPARVPPRLLEWQARLDVDALRPGAVPGVTRPAPRAPLNHYHGVDRWFQSDPRNDCTTSGCHAPLPHMRSKEVRALANAHVTFLDCMMCHDRSTSAEMPAVWVNASTGNAQDAPALLRLAKLLERDDRAKEETAALHGQALDLLRESIEIAAGDAFLDDVRVRMNTAEPGSPAWRRAVEHLRAELPVRLRGEYGAKLMPEALAADGGGLRTQRARRCADLPANSPERAALHEEIHATVLPRPAACVACHSLETPRLDFEALGYTPRRAAQLRSSPVARMMRQIQEGLPFHLPRLLEPTDDR